MEEDIKKLERYLNGDEIYDTELDNALRNLIARYKELEEEKELRIRYERRYNLAIENREKNFIRKSKVQEIIQENSINISGFWCIPTDDLQELIED